MEDLVSQAKGEFTRAQNRIAASLKAVPADKLNWAPSDSARTSLQIAAHAAMGTQGMQGIIEGKPFPFASMAEMDVASRIAEKQFTTIEAVLGLLDQTSSAYIAFLDSLTAEQLASTVNFPFGPIPLAAAITFPADHLRGHAAQLDYVQTIWGDLVWHM